MNEWVCCTWLPAGAKRWQKVTKSRNLWWWCTTERDSQQFLGKSTLSQCALFPTDSSAWGQAQLLLSLSKLVAQAAERLTLAHVAPRFVQSYPAVSKALGFCKTVCKATRGFWELQPLKNQFNYIPVTCWQKKPKFHLDHMLNCGKNRLFSSPSGPANHNLRDVRRIMCSPAGWGWWRELGRMVEFQIGFGHAASQCQVKKSHWVWTMNTSDGYQEKGKPQKDKERIQTP